MLRVAVYLKSGAVAEFEAETILESGDPHPKFKLGFPPAEAGGRRLVYLDRDDVSAVVVEDRHLGGPLVAAQVVEASLPVAVPETIRQEVQEVLAVASQGAADPPAP